LGAALGTAALTAVLSSRAHALAASRIPPPITSITSSSTTTSTTKAAATAGMQASRTHLLSRTTMRSEIMIPSSASAAAVGDTRKSSGGERGGVGGCSGGGGVMSLSLSGAAEGGGGGVGGAVSAKVAEARAKFAAQWWLYCTIPVVAAVLNWLTNALAVKMIFCPEEYVGLDVMRWPETPAGLFGWQGIVPCKVRKMSTTMVGTAVQVAAAQVEVS
jgi:hypothetical protein